MFVRQTIQYVMKRLFLLVSLVACSFLIGNKGVAQSVKIGLKGGISVANQQYSGGNVSFTPDSKIRPHFGLFLNVKPIPQLGIQPELLFAGQGYGKSSGTFPEEGVNFNYLAVPIMLKYYPVGMVNIHAGPQLGFLIGGDSFNGVSVTEETKKAEVALCVGAEVFPIDMLGFSVRYVAGLSDIYDGANADQITVKNKTIQFSVLISLN